MAGNSSRPGAKRRPGSKKGATKGTGGKNQRGLRGKGPTPKAEDRPYHAAHERKVERERKAAGAAARAAAAERKRAIKIPFGHELIAGRNAVAEAVRAGVPIERVFMVPAAVTDERLGHVVRTATALGAPLLEVTRRDLDHATDDAVHQGVAIEVPEFKYCDLDDLFERAERLGEPPLLVALDSVTDPHNVGAALRSAAAFGAHGLILPERRAAGVTTAAWKVSAGAAARVPVARVTNLTQSLKECQERGCFVIGLDGGGETTVRGSKLADGPVVIVTGAEGSGLSRLVRETCDVVASIPIRREVESLNAAVATAIALYDVAQVRSEVAENTDS